MPARAVVKHAASIEHVFEPCKLLHRGRNPAVLWMKPGMTSNVSYPLANAATTAGRLVRM